MFSRPRAKVEELVGKMNSDLMNLEHMSLTEEESFNELKDYISSRSVMLASTPSILPAKGWVTSNFGSRISPFTGVPQHQTGLDIANRVGTPVSASADGMVVEAGKDANLGKFVVISHGYGIKTTYGHLSEAMAQGGAEGQKGRSHRPDGQHRQVDWPAPPLRGLGKRPAMSTLKNT